MAQYEVVQLEYKFTGTEDQKGKFTLNIRKPKFIWEQCRVSQIAYDGGDGVAGPITLWCQALGGFVGTFMSTNSQVAATSAPVNVISPGTRITNLNQTELSGMTEFSAMQGGALLGTLTGRLVVILEMKRQREE